MIQDDLHIKSGMKVPEGYFDSSKNAILDIIAEKSFPSEKGFKVPEKYFEQSKESILKATTKKRKVFSMSSIAIYSVASVIIVILLSPLWIYFTDNKADNLTFTDLTSSEINNYLNENYSEETPFLILEQVGTMNLENLTVNEEQRIKNIDVYLSEYDYNWDEFY